MKKSTRKWKRGDRVILMQTGRSGRVTSVQEDDPGFPDHVGVRWDGRTTTSWCFANELAPEQSAIK